MGEEAGVNAVAPDARVALIMGLLARGITLCDRLVDGVEEEKEKELRGVTTPSEESLDVDWEVMERAEDEFESSRGSVE